MSQCEVKCHMHAHRHGDHIAVLVSQTLAQGYSAICTASSWRASAVVVVGWPYSILSPWWTRHRRACSLPYSIHAVPVLSVPPEADREAHVQCPHVVPAPWGDVESLPWPQGALQSLGLHKQREPGRIRALCIYLV